MNAILALSVGAGFGFGVFLIIRALTPRPVPLTQLIANLERPGVPYPQATDTIGGGLGTAAGWRRTLGGFGIRLLDSVGFVDTGTLQDQLRILDKTMERHAYEKVLGAAVGFGIPVSMMLTLTIAGVAVNPLIGLAAAVALAIAGFFYPDWPLADQVAKQKQAFRHALSSYLDLVTIILAGGGGIETALNGAADAGDGWAFAELRNALRRAHLTRRSPWEAFDQLGEELDISELRELAAAVALSGGQGAKVKQSLIAKADAMRAALATEIEAAAEVQTEKMIVPVVVLIIGMVLFIGYGAVDAISTPATDQLPQITNQQQANP